MIPVPPVPIDNYKIMQQESRDIVGRLPDHNAKPKGWGQPSDNRGKIEFIFVLFSMTCTLNFFFCILTVQPIQLKIAESNEESLEQQYRNQKQLEMAPPKPVLNPFMNYNPSKIDTSNWNRGSISDNNPDDRQSFEVISLKLKL
jgi:hypothetical protein